VQSAAAAKCYEGEIARVIASFDGNGPDGPLHTRIRDLDHANCRSCRIAAERLEGGTRAFRIDPHFPAQQLIGCDTSQDDMGVRDGRE
jgi:hypothetical protein